MENEYLDKDEKRRIRQREAYQKNKEKINEKRRLAYLAKTTKPPEVVEREWYFKTFDDVFTGLTEQHKKTTRIHLQSAFKILNTENFEKTANTPDEVINKFRNAEIPANSKKAYFQAYLIAITDNDIPLPDDIKTANKIYFEELKLNSQDVSKLKQETIKVPEYGDFLEKLKEKFGEFSKEYIIIKMYEENTARDDYQLKIVRADGESKDPNTNYLVMPLNVKQCLKIILNTFKTRGDKHAVVNRTLSLPLSLAIRRYKINNKINDGAYLFGNLKSNGELVKHCFQSVGETGTINTLRNMKASITTNLSNEQKAKIANEMNHSINAQKQYIRQFKE